MIPKIIHLCWLSGDPFPDDIQKCLDTWSVHLRDYQVWLWGRTPESIKLSGYKLGVDGPVVIEKSFDLETTEWTKQAYEAKKYAFAADYIRLYALLNYGGIYLDADVLVYKSFDELLHLPYFIGCDQIRAFEAAVIGCEKGCNWIEDIFSVYDNKMFILANGEYDMMTLPVRFHHVLVEKGYRFVKILAVQEFFEFKNEDKILNVFHKDFFNSRDAAEVRKTKRSFCAHNYLGSWQKNREQNVVKKLLPMWLLKYIYIIGQATYNRNKYSWFQIPFEK